MRVAIVIACITAGLAAVMGVLFFVWDAPLLWGCILSGIIALAFGIRYVRLIIRAKSEPYYTEMSGVIMLVDPKEGRSWGDEPQYFFLAKNKI